MDKQILNFTVNEQNLNCENPIRISTNKVNYIEAHFDLGENWDGFDSVRAVWFNDFNCISTALDSLGNCVVPFEVMKRKGNVKVNLVGSISEDDVLTDRLTSYPVVAVIVDCTAQITGANTQPITPSEYEQFVAAVHEDAERAEAGATASEQSATESANSASASAESAQEAEAHASSAQIYAGMASNEAEASANSASEAQTYAQNASESATDAEGYAEDAESARDTILGMRATATTLPAGSGATASYSEGVMSFGIPRGDKGERGQQGEQGETGATPDISIGTVTTLDPDESATATISGTAENPILSFGIPKGDTGEVSLSELEDATVVQTLSDNTPYNYRRTNNGNGSGTREYDEIVGASVGWNQLCKKPSDGGTYSYKYSGAISYDGDTIINTSASASQIDIANESQNLIQFANGHKYFLGFSAKLSEAGSLKVYFKYALKKTISISANTWTAYSGVHISGTDEKTFIDIVTSSAVSGSGVTLSVKDICLTDLTLAFGSTIADYIYSLEQSTAGSGVTWLRTHFPRLFDNGYQPFDAGSIKSVSGLTAHEMVSANQWDEEWELGSIGSTTGENVTTTDRIRSKNYTKVIDATYYFKNGSNLGSAFVFCYDDEKNYLGLAARADDAEVANVSNRQLALRPSTAFIRFYMSNVYGTTYKNDICINLSDTSINGQYFPHESHIYPLDSSVELRGRYTLNNGQLYAVGDVWKSVGQADRNYNEIDLGALTWRRNGSGTPAQFYASLPVRGVDDITGSNVVCSKYVGGRAYGGSDDKVICIRPAQVWLKDDNYSDGTSLKASLDGVKLVYPIETSTTETAPTYENPQWCNSKGTEEYVGSELPVGHNTDYPMTLIDTADGLSNGTYEPRITVANGKKTVTWVSV